MKDELVRLSAKREELQKVITGFSQSMRSLAVSGATGQDFAAVVEALVAEKKAAEAELATLADQTRVAQAKEQHLKTTLEGQTLKVFLRKTMTRFDDLPARDQKRAIQSFLVKAVVLDDGTMQLHIIPDPGNPRAKEIILTEREGERTGTSTPRAVHNAEVESSGFVGVGSGGRI